MEQVCLHLSFSVVAVHIPILHYTIYINGNVFLYIRYSCLSYLFPVFFIFYRIHSTAGSCIQHEVKACIFTETTGIAQEWVLLVIINGSGKFKTDNYNLNFTAILPVFLGLCTIFTLCLPALVALIHILSTVATDSWIGRDRGAATRTLQGLCRCLVVLIEIREFNHQVGGHNGKREVDLHFSLARGQLHLLSFVPASRSVNTNFYKYCSKKKLTFQESD